MGRRRRVLRGGCSGGGWAAGGSLGEADPVRLQGGADLDHVGAVGADGLVEEFAGDVELLGPVGDIGGDLGVDLGFAGGDLVAVLGFGLFDGCCAGDDVRQWFLFPVLLGWMRIRVLGCPLA